MKVLIYDEALDVPAQNVYKLQMLVGYACEGRHIIDFESDDGREKCLAWYSQDLRDVYRDAIVNQLRKDGDRAADAVEIHIKSTSRSHWGDPIATVSLDDAYRVLGEPLGILVENYENDWNFLLGMMGKSHKITLDGALRERWISRIHGGGSDLKKQLRKRKDVPVERWRTFALFDSDRRHPDELDRTWQKKDQENCEGFDTEQVAREHFPKKYWMLKRRFIESYMPKSELPKAHDSRTHPDAVEAFFRMTNNQRWYYNMKRGFDDDEKSQQNKHRSRDLYQRVSVEDREALERGFGRSVADHYVHAKDRDFDWDLDARNEAKTLMDLLMRLL